MTITVLLKPNSRHRQEVVKNLDGSYTIYTKAPATEQRANQEAIKLLARYFKRPKSCIALVKGASSRLKRFELS